MRAVIGWISGIGTAVFAAALIVSVVSPITIETLAREALRTEIQKRVGEKIESLDGSKIAELAGRIAQRNAAEMEEIKRSIEDGLPQRIASVVGEMLNASCECRKTIKKSFTNAYTEHLGRLTDINTRLTDLIRAKYAEVATSLLREFRIFTGANALVFALLGVTTLVRKKAGIQLVLPAAVLLGAAVIVGGLYLFEQDWFHTILFNDYVGFGYFAYLALAVAFLADIAFNHARVTTEIVNAFFNAIGSAFTALPC